MKREKNILGWKKIKIKKEVLKIRNKDLRKRRYFIGFIILVSFFVVYSVEVYGHAEVQEKDIFNNPYFLIFLPVAAILLGVLIVHHFEKNLRRKKELERVKRIIFIAIVIITAFVSLYILFSAIYINLVSWTKGPVHWHADIEIGVCGEKFFLPESKGLRNKVGTESVHHHNDMRMHIEGVVMNRHDATLGEFFDSVGVEFSESMIANMKDGDLCPDGSVGKVRMFVNGEENFEFRDYLISPYPDVPPGDRIKITFGK